jgi:ribonuclease H2 subunit B
MLTNAALHEVNVFRPPLGSWLVGDSVLADGALHVCSPVDPLLLLLPTLERLAAAGNFVDAEQVLEAAGGAAPALRPLLAGGALAAVCDAKAAGGEAYYRLSEARALAWLRLKVAAARGAFAALDPAFAQMEGHSLTAYAAAFLSEYLSPAWQGLLARELGLPDPAEAAAAAAAAAAWAAAGGGAGGGGSQPDAKRPRTFDPKEAARAKAAEARVAARVAKAAKEAKTMRKLSSFFGKKPAAA